MPRRGQAFLSPFQVAAQRIGGGDRLLQYLPRWLQGPISRAVSGAVGRQLDAIDGLGLDDQLFVATATWGLAFDGVTADGSPQASGWERDYGLAVRSGDSYATRRARVLGRMQAHAIRTAGEFAAYVRALLLPRATCAPTIYETFGRWTVFKPCDRGFPTNFADVEAALALVGPAHEGLWLAPHREAPDTGLTVAQLAMMRVAAVSVLTLAEIGGL